MELIPVLSTIILVATITTFILAIGAYVLYKKREKQGEQYTSYKNFPVTAEVVTSAEGTAPSARTSGRVYTRPLTEKVTLSEKMTAGYSVKPKIIRVHTKPAAEQTTPGKFLKYTPEGYVPPKDDDKRGALKWR